jgi:hypothetical protein
VFAFYGGDNFVVVHHRVVRWMWMWAASHALLPRSFPPNFLHTCGRPSMFNDNRANDWTQKSTTTASHAFLSQTKREKGRKIRQPCPITLRSL